MPGHAQQGLGLHAMKAPSPSFQSGTVGGSRNARAGNGRCGPAVEVILVEVGGAPLGDAVPRPEAGEIRSQACKIAGEDFGFRAPVWRLESVSPEIGKVHAPGEPFHLPDGLFEAIQVSVSQPPCLKQQGPEDRDAADCEEAAEPIEPSRSLRIAETASKLVAMSPAVSLIQFGIFPPGTPALSVFRTNSLGSRHNSLSAPR